ncbi:MAG: AAA family ATPase [Sphingomonas sp.]
MNDPTELPINVEDMIEWLDEYRRRTGKSWQQIGKISGMPTGTISLFGKGNYNGDNENVARRVLAFRQKVESQEQRTDTVLAEPDFVETETARRLLILLEMAQMGRIVCAAMGSGTSKSMVAKHFRKCMGESVYLVTLRHTTGGVTPMIRQVMRAMRLRPDTNGRAACSEAIMDHVRHAKATIIFDEANHMQLESIEEVRAWHDETGVGIALFGNEELAFRIRGGRRSHQYARLARRIAKFYVQDLLTEADIAAFLDAMNVDDPKTRRLLVQVGTSPGHGGLGEVQQILETAHMFAIGEDKALEFEHVEAASRSRVTQILRGAA